MKILLTGASGMLGRYICEAMGNDHRIITLQRHDADICCDLSIDVPDIKDERFDLVIHAAGSQNEDTAFSLNFDGTRHLIEALSKNPPANFVYLSSWEVYSPDAGENVEESAQAWAATKVGQSKARAEAALEKWSAENGVRLTILRPARMFGKGVGGEMKSLYNDVLANRYIHVRGNDASLSLVCASDVAEVVKNLHSIGGIYNICDGKRVSWIELAEAMSANAGAMKRQTHLPEKWADIAWKYFRALPAVKSSLSPETLSRRGKTLTLSDAALKNIWPGWKPYPTIDVIKRECPDYPYKDR